MRVTFCGVRGSTPAPGPDFVRYGGHTSCVALAHDDQRPTLLLDGGTGLMRVTDLLGATPFDGTLLIGHLHWDHTHGIPFFRSGNAHGSRVDVLIPQQVPGRPGDAHATLGREVGDCLPRLRHVTLRRALSLRHHPAQPERLGLVGRAHGEAHSPAGAASEASGDAADPAEHDGKVRDQVVEIDVPRLHAVVGEAGDGDGLLNVVNARDGTANQQRPPLPRAHAAAPGSPQPCG